MGIRDADLWKLLLMVGLGFYSKNEEVLSPGEDPLFFYVIISGSVDVYHPNQEATKLHAEITKLEG